MRIVRFSWKDQLHYGILDGEEIALLEHDPIFAGFQTTQERIATGQVERFLAPVIPRSKIVGVGKNYADHAKEMGGQVPREPLLFLKPNTTVIGNEDEIRIPSFSQQVDYEGEIAVVIGAIAKDVSEKQALEYVFGYTLANDVTARDVQNHDGQWSRAKGADTFCPLGPVIQNRFDPQASLMTKLNGKIVQETSISQMHFGIAELVSYISQCFTLLPGDIILTGTPAGVGVLKPGDTVEVVSDFIGTLTNSVV